VANAHSELASASPAPNGSVVAAPVAVTITFTEAVEPASASIELLDSQGRIVPGVGGIVVSPDGRTAGVSLPDLGPGVYTVSYRVVSTVDGHATDGSYAFLVDPTGAAPPPADSAEATSPSVDPLTVAARWLGLAAMLVAIGAMASWRLTARPVLRDGGLDDSPPWHLVSLSALAGAAGVIGYLLLAARPLAGSGGTGIPLDPAAAFGWSPFAIAMRVGIGCLVAAGLMAWRGGGRRRASIRPGVVLALLAVAAGAMSLAGHLASSGGAIGAILDAGHQLAVATWLGALPAALVLGARAGDRRRTTLRILRAHGPVALVAAPVVVLTGLAGSAVVLGSRRDLIGTDYGNVLLAKVLLLAVALAIGAVNHFTVRGRGRAAVMALVGAELVAGAGAVGLAATMVTIQPASARPATVAA
jgi:copper transport protein